MSQDHLLLSEETQRCIIHRRIVFAMEAMDADQLQALIQFGLFHGVGADLMADLANVLNNPVLLNDLPNEMVCQILLLVPMMQKFHLQSVSRRFLAVCDYAISNSKHLIVSKVSAGESKYREHDRILMPDEIMEESTWESWQRRFSRFVNLTEFGVGSLKGDDEIMPQALLDIVIFWNIKSLQKLDTGNNGMPFFADNMMFPALKKLSCNNLTREQAASMPMLDQLVLRRQQTLDVVTVLPAQGMQELSVRFCPGFAMIWEFDQLVKFGDSVAKMVNLQRLELGMIFVPSPEFLHVYYRMFQHLRMLTSLIIHFPIVFFDPAAAPDDDLCDAIMNRITGQNTDMREISLANINVSEEGMAYLARLTRLEEITLCLFDQISTEALLILLRGGSRRTIRKVYLKALRFHFMDVQEIMDELTLISNETGRILVTDGLKNPAMCSDIHVCFRDPGNI